MPGDVTALLERWNTGDDDAGRQVMERLYGEVRRIAGHEYKREQRPDHTLQPTAIAHEAYMRMVQGGSMDASGRTHFLALTARVVRQVLVDYGRGRSRRKRGGDQVRVDLTADELLEHAGEGIPDFVDLDRALGELETIDAQASSIVELKFLGGLTVSEIAEHLDISDATVSRKWKFARLWLRGALSGD